MVGVGVLTELAVSPAARSSTAHMYLPPMEVFRG